MSRSAPPDLLPPTQSIPPLSRRWPKSVSTSPRSHRRSSPPDTVESSDVVITMGCGDACPVFPGVRYRDWALDDPAGQGIDAVRPIRDQIRGLVEDLLDELVPADQQVGR